MLNLTRTIKSLPLIAVLFTCVVILSSAAIFASEDGIPSSEVTSWLAPDLDSLQVKQLAEEVYPKLSDATRAVHDVNDIYLLLYDDIRPALQGVSSSSLYSLPRIAFYEREIYNAIFGNASGSNFFDGLHELLTYYAGGQYYSIAALQGMTWARTGDINSNLNLANSYLNSISSQLSGNFNWLTFSSSFQGAKSSYGGDWLSPGTYNDLYFFFNVPAQYNLFPNVLLVNLPVYAQYNLNAGEPPFRIVEIFNDGDMADASGFDYFLEPTNAGSNLYLFNYTQRGTSMVFHVQSEQLLNYNSSYGGYMRYIPFDTDDYQQLKQSFYQAKSANAQGSMAYDVKRLADYLADPDKIAAEQASQQVIDDTLDGFTGSGSAAAKGSDIGSMKNISGSVQSGLDTGAGVSNATNVFSLNGGFWGWFTQSNSDQINNPYPAPVVNNNRKSSGDDVVDFLSDNQSQVKDLLGESKW